MSDSAGRLAQWVLWLFKPDFDVVQQARVEEPKENALLSVRIDGEQSTDVDDDRPVCNVEKSQMTSEKVSDEHNSSECIAKMYETSSKPDEDIFK